MPSAKGTFSYNNWTVTRYEWLLWEATDNNLVASGRTPFSAVYRLIKARKAADTDDVT